MDNETQRLILEQAQVINKMLELILRMMDALEHPPVLMTPKDKK